MQLTPNYNLKKPEETDPIDILDLNDNADIIDAELKKRPAASGGDVSEMTVKTLEEVKSEFPVPVAGESTKTFLSKVKKFFEDTKNWMTGVCMLGQLVNNCVTNRSDLPLAAAQGKVLMDLYTKLNSDLNGYVKNSVFTTYKTIGTYSSINTYSTENVSKYRMLLFRITIGTAYFFVFLPVSVIASSSGGGWKHVTQNGYVTFLFTSYTTFRIAEVYDSYFKNITIYAL